MNQMKRAKQNDLPLRRALGLAALVLMTASGPGCAVHERRRDVYVEPRRDLHEERREERHEEHREERREERP
jgi:membrane protein YdbS with pleckstrin-like domain